MAHLRLLQEVVEAGGLACTRSTRDIQCCRLATAEVGAKEIPQGMQLLLPAKEGGRGTVVEGLFCCLHC